MELHELGLFFDTHKKKGVNSHSGAKIFVKLQVSVYKFQSNFIKKLTPL